MPLTLFHPVPVWLLWLKYPRRLDFVALTIGSVIPDLLEPVFLLGFEDLYWTHRDLSHSILGALTYDLVLTLVACRYVVRPLLGWLDRVRPSPLWNRFGGLDYREPKPPAWTVVSAAIGTLSHPMSDLPFHTVTTLLFPGPRVRIFPEAYASLLGTISVLLFVPAFVFLLYEYWWRPSHRDLPVGRDATE